MLRSACFFAFCAAIVASTAIAAPDAGATRAALLDAVNRAPALVAARQRVEAARARTESAGRLPDPEVEAMASRVNAGAMGENRDMWELNLRQPLPKRGERAADRDRAAAAVSLAVSEHAVAAGELAADVALSLAEAEGAQARSRLLEAQLGRLDAVLQTLETRLSAGASVRLADRLTVQSRIAALQLAVERARTETADALAAARGRLGLPPAAPLPAFAAPDTAEIEAASAAIIAAAQARAAAADAEGRIARASANPMTAVGLRFERERSSMGNEDIVGLAFMSEIPFRSRRYARAEVRAAAAERSAAESDATAARHQISTTLARVARAERLAATARRLGVATEQRLAAEHDALSRAAAVSATDALSGQTAVLHAVDILDQSTATQLEIIDAETAANTARTALWRYLPAAQLSASLNSQPTTLN